MTLEEPKKHYSMSHLKTHHNMAQTWQHQDPYLTGTIWIRGLSVHWKSHGQTS